MSALLDLVVMDEFGKSALCPTPRGWIELVRKDAHGNRDGDAFGIEVPEFAPNLPIEPGARKRRVRCEAANRHFGPIADSCIAT